MRLEENRFWLSLADSDIGLWASGLAYRSGLDVTIGEVDVAPVQLQGPKSRDVIAALFGEKILEIPYYGMSADLRYYSAISNAHRKIQIGLTNWGADFPSPATFFVASLTCRSFGQSHMGRPQWWRPHPAGPARHLLPGQSLRPASMPLPGAGPRRPDRLQCGGQVVRQTADQAGHHRIGGHRPKQPWLRPKHRDIGQAVPAQRQRRHQIGDDLPRIVDRPRRPPPRQPSRKATVHAGQLQRPGQQQPARLGHDPRSVSRHSDLGAPGCSLHLKSAFRAGRNGS